MRRNGLRLNYPLETRSFEVRLHQDTQGLAFRKEKVFYRCDRILNSGQAATSKIVARAA
jgi:hypothetical protein